MYFLAKERRIMFLVIVYLESMLARKGRTDTAKPWLLFFPSPCTCCEPVSEFDIAIYAGAKDGLLLKAKCLACTGWERQALSLSLGVRAGRCRLARTKIRSTTPNLNGQLPWIPTVTHMASSYIFWLHEHHWRTATNKGTCGICMCIFSGSHVGF